MLLWHATFEPSSELEIGRVLKAPLRYALGYIVPVGRVQCSPFSHKTLHNCDRAIKQKSCLF